MSISSKYYTNPHQNSTQTEERNPKKEGKKEKKKISLHFISFPVSLRHVSELISQSYTPGFPFFSFPLASQLHQNPRKLMKRRRVKRKVRTQKKLEEPGRKPL